jgi:glycosyltransferase involved in cell wall biosynthesis
MMTVPADYSDLTIVIPAFNEEAGIVATLRSLTSEAGTAEIIVVDDASTDATAEAARSFAAVRVLRHEFNCGQGAALKTGMRHATRKYVAWFDADNEHRVGDLAKLYSRMTRERLVACIGQRRRSASMVRGVGKALIRLIGRGLKIRSGTDLNCGLRIFQRMIILQYLSLIPDRFSASLVSTLIMLERRYPIAFEEVKTNERVGTSSVRMRDGFEAILQLVRSVLLFAPLRFFMPIGIATFIVGIAYSFVIEAIVRQGLPVGGMFLMVTGVQMLVLGLLGDQLSQHRLSQMGDAARISEANEDNV